MSDLCRACSSALSFLRSSVPQAIYFNQKKRKKKITKEEKRREEKRREETRREEKRREEKRIRT